MNDTVCQTLSAWQQQTRGDGENLVFPSLSGKQISSVHYLWKKLLMEAEISDFHWHDMRHDFASRLVMAGVDLNTVRELLGHADMKMTLRYAHLAPQMKQRAVNILDNSK
jgi:site-specific recombinase XerD